MLRNTLVAVLALSGLAACGGSSSGGLEPVSAATATKGAAFGVHEVNADVRRIGVPTGANVLSLTATRDSTTSGAFQRFRGTDAMLFEAQGASGVVRVFARVDKTGSGVGAGAIAERFDGSSIPTSGSATLSGSYVGFLTRDETTTIPNLTQAYISGTAVLAADFGSGELSGRITDRVRRSTASDAFLTNHEDVTLGTASIVDGRVHGASSGGALSDPRYVPAGGGLRGDYTALIGDGGNEIGGVLRIEHDYLNNPQTPDDYVEIGGFAVSR